MGFVEYVRLDHQRGTRFAEVALHGDGDQVATVHVGMSPRSSRTPSMNLMSSVSFLSAFAASRDCRRHSSAKAGRLVSGTQSWMGRMPASRILARWRMERGWAVV